MLAKGTLARSRKDARLVDMCRSNPLDFIHALPAVLNVSKEPPMAVTQGPFMPTWFQSHPALLRRLRSIRAGCALVKES